VSDALFALFLVVMGFCFWEWQVIDTGFGAWLYGTWTAGRGVGTTLFFCLLLAGSCVYLARKNVRQTKASLALLGLAAAASLPFALFGAREIDLPLLVFESCLCLLWLACACKTLIATKLSSLLAFDLLSQTFIIPLANFGQLFVRGAQGLSKKRVGRQVLITLVGLVVSLPLIGLVVFLLVNSDNGFRSLILEIEHLLDGERLVEYGGKFILGIPVACCVFGSVVGNSLRRLPNFKQEALGQSFVRAHVIARAALYGVLLLLVAIYVSYFLAMTNYLFSALGGSLPAEYTYAEYARQGFFELCWVAVINLCVLATSWVFARRARDEYPVLLRVLTGLIALLTCLLVITAASKMWLYIQTYGLTPLRVYTSWFMLVLLVSFLLLTVWHLRPFNVARPVIVATLALTLLLSYTNVDGLIARYNVDGYLSGKTERIDTQMLARLSNAAVPALCDLREQTDDPTVREEAAEVLSERESLMASRAGEGGTSESNPASGTVKPWKHWYDANLVSYLAWKRQ
jgi:hypothetical protein